MYIYNRDFNYADLLNEREIKAFNIINNIFKGKTTRRGFSRTSFFEPAYGEAETIQEQFDIIEDILKEADGNPLEYQRLLQSHLPRK